MRRCWCWFIEIHFGVGDFSASAQREAKAEAQGGFDLTGTQPEETIQQNYENHAQHNCRAGNCLFQINLYKLCS
jgi:hypothetical protein